MKRLHWIILVVILILGFYLWLTSYQYRNWRGSIVRINRITGAADVLKIDGWQRMEPEAPKKRITLEDLGLEEPKPK